MEQITLQLSGSKVENTTKIYQSVNVAENENYYSALSRSLETAQVDFNSILTKIVDEDKKRSKGILIFLIVDIFGKN